MKTAENLLLSSVPALAEIGLLLHKSRTEKGVAIEEIARDLHLSVGQINALEAGEFSGFKFPAFVKGYLRSCARFYGLDGDELVRAYEATLPKTEAISPAVIERSGRVMIRPQRNYKKPLLWIMSVLVVCVAVWFFLDHYRPDPTSGNGVDIAQPLPVTVSVPVAAPEVHAQIEQVVAPVAIDQLATGIPGIPPVEQALVTPGQDNQGPLLHIEFSDDCWIQLKTNDGKILHEKVHKKGEIFDIAAAAPLRVWIGRAAAVNISYNGAVVKVPAKPGFQSAQFILGDDVRSDEIE